MVVAVVVGAVMVADGLPFVWCSLFSFLRRLVLSPPSISEASVPAATVCRSDQGRVGLDGWQWRCLENGRSS